LEPQAVQGFERGPAVGLLLRQKAADDQASAADAGAAVHVDAFTERQSVANGSEQLPGLPDIVGYPCIDDGGAQVFDAKRQKVPIGRQFGLFGEIDEVIDTGVLQFRKSRPRFAEAGAAGIFTGQQSAGNHPIGVGERSIRRFVENGQAPVPGDIAPGLDVKRFMEETPDTGVSIGQIVFWPMFDKELSTPSVL
jgi:hypothetical protein